MAFLQISEPGQSAAKTACAKVVVGIDLGTTNSLVANVQKDDDGKAQMNVLPDASGEVLLPSVVSFTSHGSVVGTDAIARGVTDPESTIASAKRFIGRSFADVADAVRDVAVQVVGQGAEQVRFSVDGRAISPHEVSAEVLRALKVRAELALGQAVESAVITVPAYFDDAQRQATKDAAKLAGLEPLRLLAEPTAAAVAYGLDQGTHGLYAVYDLGGGTFDFSLLTLDNGVFRVKAVAGDTSLGGDDIDRAIAQWLTKSASIDAKDLSPQEKQALSTEARRIKHVLSEVDHAEWKISVAGKNQSGTLTRTEFATLAQPFLVRTQKLVQRALKDAETDVEDIDGVILVGGSTKAPVVQNFVQSFFGKPPLCTLDPEQVVAMGAAQQAFALSGQASELLLLDVVPLSLGIETMGGIVEKIIPRNETIPTRAVQTFTTYADKQTGFDIHVVQGERETVAGNRSLAKFTLRGIPPMVAGMARIEITFEVDVDGLLRVSAKELTTGKTADIEIKPSFGLAAEEVEKMLLDSYAHAESDMALRNLATEKIEAEQIAAMTEKALAHDPELWTPEVKIATEAAISALRNALTSDNYLTIRKAITALDLASKPFAEAKMNRAVSSAVTGRRVTDAMAFLANKE